MGTRLAFWIYEAINIFYTKLYRISSSYCRLFSHTGTVSAVLQVRVEEEDEDGCVEEQEEEEEEENWEKALSVERFSDIISDSASTSGDRMGRHYTEKDFECEQSCHLHVCTCTYTAGVTNCFGEPASAS